MRVIVNQQGTCTSVKPLASSGHQWFDVRGPPGVHRGWHPKSMNQSIGMIRSGGMDFV